MRFEGTITTWHDDRGFGFITPTHGGADIFVHVKAFRRRDVRPAVDQRVTFAVELNPEGKKRAKSVDMVRAARSTPRRPVAARGRTGGGSYFAIAGFAVLYVVVDALWHVPAWAAGIYVAASAAAFALYGVDKSAARAQARRTPEKTLLVIGLLGGWPGAILAQQLLRHKSAKASFRAAFWATVVVNVGAFLLLASPGVRELLPL